MIERAAALNGCRHARHSFRRRRSRKVQYDGRTFNLCHNQDEFLASMKSMLYYGESAFNEIELLATTCPCRAVCKSESLDRLGASPVACSHAVAGLVEASEMLFCDRGDWEKEFGANNKTVNKSIR